LPKLKGNDQNGLPEKEGERKKMSKRNEQGFTLIELLVVVAIIGILAAIAIPQYATYKQQAADSKAKSDLHNMATAMEAYYGSNANAYTGVTTDTLKTYGYRQSTAVSVAIGGPTADATQYGLTASPTGGTKTFTFQSTTGQIQ
jgi:type IV pilus assembly protein PilA